MSINVNGKNEKLWITERQSRNGGTWPDYSIGISKKNKDGSYTNVYIKVRFSSKLTIPKGLSNGTEMDFEGFFTPDVYTDRNGKEVKDKMIMITSVKFHGIEDEDDGYDAYDGVDDFAHAEDDIPF